MSINNLTAPPAVLPQTEIWCDETGLHIRQAGATIFIPAGSTGTFFDGLLQILVGSPRTVRADRVILG